jgi:hypothetical protein
MVVDKKRKSMHNLLCKDPRKKLVDISFLKKWSDEFPSRKIF